MPWMTRARTSIPGRSWKATSTGQQASWTARRPSSPRRQRHRRGRGHRVRQRGRRRGDRLLLVRRRRAGGGRAHPRTGTARARVQGRRRRRGVLPRYGRGDRGRMGSPRRAREQRRRADTGREHPRLDPRAAGPHVPDQHLQHVLPGESRTPPPARGRRHREHHVGDRLSGLAEPAGLLGHEGGYHRVHPARSPRTKTS